jgi:predicted Zn finger-like uncharacterized protein
MLERMIRVSCPQCGAGYRVDLDSVPAEGATASCKKCGRRFSITKSADGPPAAQSSVPPAAAKTPSESRLTCPRCGHHQTQPYNCYACGAVITPKDPAPTAQAVSDAAAQKTGVASPLNPGMGEIVVRARFNPSDWLLNFAKPRVSIDGMEHHQGWGAHAFQALEGDCPLAIDYRYFIKYHGRGTLTVHASTAEKVYVDYCPRTSSSSAAGAVRRASTAEGLLWRIQSKSDRSQAKGLYTRKAVIISLIVMGPLGLYQLWKSEAFSNRTKIVITAIVVLLSYWVFSKLSLPTGSLLMK